MRELIPEITGFHLQQAAEKSLKAWLDIWSTVYPKTHILSLLLTELEDHGENIKSFRSIIELTPFAVQFRYEVYLDEEEFDWKDAYNRTANLISHVEKLFQRTEGS